MSASSPPRRSLLEADSNVAILLGVVVLAVGIWAISPYPVGVFVDDGYYVVLAKSLATGHGLRYLQMPGAPFATHFPPGYPAFLSLLWMVAPAFPKNVVLFKLGNAVLLGVATTLGYLFAVRRLRLSRRLAVPAVLLGTASIPALVLAAMVLSETLFLALLVGTIFAAEYALETPSPRRIVAVGVLCGLLALVRALGLAAFPVAALLMWRRAGWRRALALAGVALALILPWQVWVLAHQGDVLSDLGGSFGSYGSWLAQSFHDIAPGRLLAVPLQNLKVVRDTFRVLLAPLLPLPVKDAFLAVAVGAWVVGAWAAARRAPVMIGTMVVYLCVVLVFPFVPNRFVWGIWLLIALLFATGVSAIAGWRAPGRRAAWLRGTALAACALVAAGSLVYNVRGYVHRWWEAIPRGQTERAAPILRWVVAHTHPGDVLVCDDDNMVYLYTGRLALPPYTFTGAQYVQPPPDSLRADGLRHILGYAGASYLVTADGSVLRAAALLTGRRGIRLEPIGELRGGGEAFRVERVPPGDASAGRRP